MLLVVYAQSDVIYLNVRNCYIGKHEFSNENKLMICKCLSTLSDEMLTQNCLMVPCICFA